MNEADELLTWLDGRVEFALSEVGSYIWKSQLLSEMQDALVNWRETREFRHEHCYLCDWYREWKQTS